MDEHFVTVDSLCSYTIEDDQAKSMFKLDTRASVCLVADQPCQENVPILQNVEIPKPLCNLNTSFTVPGLILLLLY